MKIWRGKIHSRTYKYDFFFLFFFLLAQWFRFLLFMPTISGPITNLINTFFSVVPGNQF